MIHSLLQKSPEEIYRIQTLMWAWFWFVMNIGSIQDIQKKHNSLKNTKESIPLLMLRGFIDFSINCLVAGGVLHISMWIVKSLQERGVLP